MFSPGYLGSIRIVSSPPTEAMVSNVKNDNIVINIIVITHPLKKGLNLLEKFNNPKHTCIKKNGK